MVNLLKDEITHAEAVITKAIDHASGEINKTISEIGRELSTQRTLTKEELERLIQFAASTFAGVIDERIEKAKKEVANLVTDKLAEVRTELSEAATAQKRSAIRNATIAIFSALLIALVSFGYRKSLGGGTDLYFTFRAVLLAIVAGHSIWLASRYISNYLYASKLKKDLVFYGAQFVGFFRIKGLGGHLLAMLLMAAAWGYLTFFHQG